MTRGENKVNCTQCKKEPDERYIIDAKGTKYCSEDCMDQYLEELDIPYDPHPYEDTYLYLRRSYIEILNNWENVLDKKTTDLENAVDELLEEIDELIGGQADFVRAEGDDGSFAWEIYQYTLKLAELQKRIFTWRPNRKMLYWVKEMNTNYGSLEKDQEKIYDKICTDLYFNGYEDFILYYIKHHQHPYHWGVNFVFDNPEMAKEAYELLKSLCEKNGVDISIVESLQCEAHCGDILEVDAGTYINGWFYCYSCKESGDHGIFTQQELAVELQYYEENEDERQMVIFERKDWCATYKSKIMRSCREHDVEVPSWAD